MEQENPHLKKYSHQILIYKRGLNLLVKHRLKRIGIPLLLSLVTVIPAMTCVSVFALIANGTKDGGIIEEARKGDIDSLKKYLT